MSNEMQSQFNNSQIMGGNPVPEGSAAVTNSSREMEEVKGQIFMAKQFPRNTFQAQKRIEDACKRKSLAMTATYSYPKGGQNVTGPSIRLAEVLAQNWGNIAFGFKELDQNEESSTAMAYAWDVETNTRQERIFQVPHAIHTRKGMKVLSDPRDIYELVANQASRRVRACILSIIPGDVTEDAVSECNKTLAGDNTKPLKERLAHAFDGFKENYSVTQNRIETYFGYAASEFSENDFVELVNIANSLNEKASNVSDWFPETTEPDTNGASKPAIAKDFGKAKKPTAKTSDKKAVKSSDSSQGKSQGKTGSKEPDKADQGELL